MPCPPTCPLGTTVAHEGLPWWLSGKEPTCQFRKLEFNPWVGKIPWRSKWQATPVFLPGKSHGQRSLVGLQSTESQRVRHDLVTKQQCCLFYLHAIALLFISPNIPNYHIWRNYEYIYFSKNLRASGNNEIMPKTQFYDVSSQWIFY